MQAERMNQASRAAQFLRDYSEQHFISHEREELVEKVYKFTD
jgi:hypothetical protein